MHRRLLDAVRRQPCSVNCKALSSRASRQYSSYLKGREDTQTSSRQHETSRFNSPSSSCTGIGPSPSLNSTLSNSSSNPDDTLGPQPNFAKPMLEVLDFFRRAVKFSLIGVVILGGSTLAAFEGVHQWVEYQGLASEPDPDGEFARWGWDCSLAGEGKWPGDERGGTDPALGIKARHAVRSAWIARQWGPGPDFLATNPINRAQRHEEAMEPRLVLAHDFLSIALSEARKRVLDGRLSEKSVADIVAQHAATLERSGSQRALRDALNDYHILWQGSGGQDLNAACIAQKLGEVSARLGMGTEALEWWSRALYLVSDSHATQSLPSLDSRLEIPHEPPGTPFAQRLLASLLTSLSAHYAQVGRLEDARDIEESGLAMLKSATDELAPSPFTTSAHGSAKLTNDMKIRSKSPSETLHILFLQHRASLLVLHASEVSHALHATDSNGTLAQLTYAASLAEQIVSILSTPNSASANSTKQGQGAGLLSDKYSSSKTLRTPASSLLRDARRTAMHAWALAGVIHENAAAASTETSSDSGSNSFFRRKREERISKFAVSQAQERREALTCYERAIECAGARDGRPGEHVLESEWNTLWNRYLQTREALIASDEGPERAHGN